MKVCDIHWMAPKMAPKDCANYAVPKIEIFKLSKSGLSFWTEDMCSRPLSNCYPNEYQTLECRHLAETVRCAG
jgi:hypothetical protein